MRHEQLWAPWRIGYVTGSEKSGEPAPAESKTAWEAGADKTCFLCRYVAEGSDDAASEAIERRNFVVARTRHAVAVLNRYPYNNGHLLVAPRRHQAGLADLSDEEHLDLMRTLTRMCSVLEQKVRPEGFNVGLNLGRVAGAGLPGHLHWHIVPRWNGDTNFMPTVAGVRVIPQSLEAMWETLREGLGGEADRAGAGGS